MKILVTGAAGFIGSNLVEALVQEGHTVVGVDNLLTGSKKNLEEIKNDFEFLEGDVRDETLMDRLTKKVERISHQAAASSHAVFSKALRESMAINIDGFVVVLQCAVKNGVERVVYASSSSIYGNRPIPFKETQSPDPTYLFSASKLANEHMAQFFGLEQNLETVGMRYMSVFGPHEEEKAKVKAANLVTQFFWDLSNGVSPLVYGDGTQTRDSVYVKDVAKANLLALTSPKKFIGEVVNVGTAEMMSLNEIVSFLNRFLGTDIPPHYVPMPLKKYMRFQLADLSHAQELLGYKPRYDLQSGLKDFLACR